MPQPAAGAGARPARRCLPVIDPRDTTALAGSPHRWGDYPPGEKDRPCRRHDGRGGRASAGDPPLPEHRQGSFQPAQRRPGPVRPPADLWRPCHLAGPRLSFNGLANAFHVAAINGGRHVALFAGHTVYAWTEVRSAPKSTAATTSARCACARSRPRTSPAPPILTGRTKATTRASSSISITGR